MTEIRPARAADVPALAALHVAAWRAAFRGILPDLTLEGLSTAGFEDAWRRNLKRRSRKNLVAIRGLRVAGFVAFGSAATGTEAEIHGVYVDPGFWRQGVGRALMAAAVSGLAAEGHGCAAVWVMKDNRRARLFYESEGFSTAGRERSSQREGSSFVEVEYTRALSTALSRPPTASPDSH